MFQNDSTGVEKVDNQRYITIESVSFVCLEVDNYSRLSTFHI